MASRSHLRQLGILSQLVAISIILPAPVMLLLGPFFLYMLCYALLGKKATLLYILIDFCVDAPQFIVQGSSAVAVSTGPAAATVASMVSNPVVNPLEIFFATHIIFTLVLLAVTLLVDGFMVKMFVIGMWRMVTQIRARLPPHLWRRYG